MTKLQDLPPYIKETLALQEIFLQLGHEQGDLYVVFARDALGMSVYKSGQQHMFLSALRPAGKDQDELVAEWRQACDAWNASPQDERHELVESSDARRRTGLLVGQLVILGLMPACRVEINCPFCGRRVVADRGEMSTSHAAPPCSKFLEMDTLQFLKECRYAIEGN